MKKPLPIGISDFKKLIEGGYAYVDKSLFEEKQYAQELLDRGVRRILYLGLAFEGKQMLIRSKLKSQNSKNY